MSKIKVKGKMQRVAVMNSNRVVGRAVRYSTVKGDQLVSYASQSSHIPESTLRACTLAMREAISYFVLIPSSCLLSTTSRSMPALSKV